MRWLLALLAVGCAGTGDLAGEDGATGATGPQGEIDASGNEGRVRATVQRYQGQLTYCYEKQLKVVPTLEGRVEIGWSVSDGVVSSGPYIVANATGDADLADCVIKKIRGWEFPPDVSGEMSFPFVFSHKE